jgi:hypothetical protein
MSRRAVRCAPIAHESIRDAARISYRARVLSGVGFSLRLWRSRMRVRAKAKIGRIAASQQHTGKSACATRWQGALMGSTVPSIAFGHGPVNTSGIFDMTCPYCRKQQKRKKRTMRAEKLVIALCADWGTGRNARATERQRRYENLEPNAKEPAGCRRYRRTCATCNLRRIGRGGNSSGRCDWRRRGFRGRGRLRLGALYLASRSCARMAKRMRSRFRSRLTTTANLSGRGVNLARTRCGVAVGVAMDAGYEAALGSS